ncbi:MAG: glycosyltransferase [Bacteroidaceae bacterium]|nr:glycosyltransferase [Bacteroidaceae bacterium]
MCVLSVIVPVHNAERCISRCLESLLQQDVESYEILCVENGSSDNSLAVLRQYERKFPHVVKVHSLSESGVSVARNFGIEHARGEVLAFCDADDYVIPKAYGHLLKAYWRADTELLKFGSVTLDKYMMTTWVETNDVRGKMQFEGDSMSYVKVCGCFPTFVWCHLYSRKFIKKYNIRYERIAIGEDLIFNMKVYTSKAQMLAVSSNIYRYTVSENQATRIRQTDKMKTMVFGYIKVFEKLIECKKKYPELDSLVCKQIEREMLTCFSRVLSAKFTPKEYRRIKGRFRDLGILSMKKTLFYTRIIDFSMQCYTTYLVVGFIHRFIFVPYVLPRMTRN